MIRVFLVCSRCQAQTDGGNYNPKTKFAQKLRREAREHGWSMSRGKDFCPTCTKDNQENQPKMKRPDPWRRAILQRAEDTNTTPAEVLAEWLPLIHNPPTTLSAEEAQALADDFPFAATTISEAFNLGTAP